MADFELVVVEDWVFFIDVAVGDEICELEKIFIIMQFTTHLLPPFAASPGRHPMHSVRSGTENVDVAHNKQSD